MAFKLLQAYVHVAHVDLDVALDRAPGAREDELWR